jgi:diacylglycerol kinase
MRSLILAARHVLAASFGRGMVISSAIPFVFLFSLFLLQLNILNIKTMNALFSFSKLRGSLKIGFLGIKNAFEEEQSFRFQVMYGILTIILTIIFPLTIIERAIIIVLMGMVLGFELLNSQMEKILDIVNPEFSHKVKLIKDFSAAAVLIVVMVAVSVGTLIFFPYFIALFKN